MPLIQETHFFITQIFLGNVFLDDASAFYSLLITPFYNFFYPIFQNPSFYYIFSILFEFFFIFYLFFLVSLISKNYLASFIAVIILSPLASATIYNIFGLYIFPNPAPAFEWGNGTLSTRYFLGLIFPLQIYFISKNESFFSSLLLACSILIHPNSFVFILGISIFCETYLFAIGNGNKKRLGLYLLILIGSLIFLLDKFYSSDYDFSESYLISDNVERYINLVRDEADDFSIIFQLTQNFLQTGFITIFIIFTLFIFSRIYKQKYHQNIFFIFTAIPLILFYLGFVVEMISYKLEIDFLLNLIIGLQPGHKLLSFSFFPAMFIWSKCLAYFFENYNLKIKPIILLSFSVLLFSISVNGALKSYDFLNGLSTIESGKFSYGDALILRSKYLNERNPSSPVIYDLGQFEEKDLKNLSLSNNLNINQTYENKYGKVLAFESLISLIRNNLVAGSGVIVPPYLFHLRDTLIDYKIFFQEHHDGNIMMGSFLATQGLMKRMQAVLGVTYTSLPLQTSKLNYTAMRYFYRKLDSNKAKLIASEFNDYNFILTEKNHNIDAKIIASNEFYNLYEITK